MSATASNPPPTRDAVEDADADDADADDEALDRCTRDSDSLLLVGLSLVLLPELGPLEGDAGDAEDAEDAGEGDAEVAP